MAPWKRGATAEAVSDDPARGSDAFLASILDCVIQPLWVVDQAELIRFVNPSAAAALGYEHASDLLGKPSHETIDIPGGRGAVVSFTDVSERRRIDSVLRERDAILSALGQPVWVITPEGTISYVNLAAVTALGFGEESELIGQDGHWLVHYKRRDGSPFPIQDCPLARVRQTGEPLSLSEDWWVRKDGSMIPVACTAMPIQAPEGYGVAVAFTDMTARLAAEHAARERDVARARAAELAASEARQRAILEAALDAVISIDGQARITYVNSAAERIFGFWAGEVTGRVVADVIVPPSLREEHGAGFARYLTTGEARILDRRIEITAMRADGSEFPAELAVTRTGPPDAPAFTGYVRDITDRQRAEQELMASRARLVAASDAARQRVTRDLHDGAQQRFVSAVISLQLVQQKWASDPDRARELLDLAVGDLKEGIDELREIAAGLHPVLLTQRGLAAALEGMTARLPIPVRLLVPERRLPGPVEATMYFFCTEALTNVVKHARASSAWVSVAADDDRCTVEVRDDGIGGAHARSDASGLAGLRDRIGALGGGMDIVSPAGSGTLLRAWVPLSPVPAA